MSEPGHAAGYKVWVGDLPLWTRAENVAAWVASSVGDDTMLFTSDIVVSSSTTGSALYAIITVEQRDAAEEVREELRG